MNEKDKPTTDEGWITLVDRRIEESTNWAERRQIMTNLNYYNGNQWIIWEPTRRTVTEAPRQGSEERITHNVIKPRVMTKLAKQTKNRIKYDVMPDTNDQKRIEVAKAATKFVHWWWDEQELDRKTRDIHLNNDVKGWCVAKVWFDTESGEDITPDESEDTIRTGEILCRICDPLTIYIDNSATCDEEIRFFIEEKPRDIDYIKAKYGKTVTPDENVSYLANYELTGYLNNSTDKKQNNMAMVREMWVKPCHEYPKGLKVTCTKHDILDLDEEAGDLPYVIFGDIPVPGSVKYNAFIQDMLPIQRNLNIALSAMATTFKRMGGNKWLVPTGSGVDEEEFDDSFDGLIHYNPIGNMKPERAQAPDMPSMFDRIIEYYNRLIDDMSGAREISQQRMPAGLDTASGLALMVEQENEKLAVNAQNYERGMKKLLKRVLKLMKAHYTEERLGRILGEDNEIELVSFTGADLSGEEDINIIQGSSLPEMKSAQQDRIMSLWGAGAIVKKDGTPDSQTLLRLLGMGDSTELFEQHTLDENNAKMENRQFTDLLDDPKAVEAVEQWYMQIQMMQQEAMMMGIDPAMLQLPPPPIDIPVWDSDDNDIHLYNHNNLRKSSDYRQKMGPGLRYIVDQHVQLHMNALAAPMIAEQQAMLQQQQAEADAKTQESEGQKQEAQASRDHQMAMKQMDLQAKAQGEQLKSKTALQQTSMKNQMA